MSDENAAEGAENETVEKETPETETDSGETEGGGAEETEGGEGGGEGEAEGESQAGGQPEREPETDWKSRFDDAERARNETNEILVRALTNSGHDPAKAADEERKKLLAMTPEERVRYHGEQSENRIRMITAQSEFKIKDANDRADFGIFCAKNPIAAKLAADVEKRLGEERKRGFNYERKTLLTYLAGEKALASADKNSSKKQRAEAKEKIASSTTKATPGAGDKKLNGRKDPNGKEALRERMAGYKF